jgi:hypothetical protein
VELGVVFTRDVAVHVLHLRFQSVSVDQGAGVRLWEVVCHGDVVRCSALIRLHVELQTVEMCGWEGSLLAVGGRRTGRSFRKKLVGRPSNI